MTEGLLGSKWDLVTYLCWWIAFQVSLLSIKYRSIFLVCSSDLLELTFLGFLDFSLHSVIISNFQLHWSCYHILNTYSLLSIIYNNPPTRIPTWILLFPPIIFWIPTIVQGMMCAPSLGSISWSNQPRLMSLQACFQSTFSPTWFLLNVEEDPQEKTCWNLNVTVFPLCGKIKRYNESA